MSPTSFDKPKLLGAALLAFALAGACGCSWMSNQLHRDKDTVAVRSPGNMQGVKHLENYEDVSQLMSLAEQPDTSVLVVSKKLDTAAQSISDAHLKLLTDWIKTGGVLWIAGPALDGNFVHSLVNFESKDFSFKKSVTGKRGGELIVRDLTPNLKIHQHPLTNGVDKLFVYPRYTIEATRETTPLVEMTDSQGAHGVVLAARALGRGFVVLDGTARDDETMSGSFPGFDPSHPNAEQTPSGYEAYDWNKLFVNAVELAQNRLQESGIYARPASGAQVPKQETEPPQRRD